MRAAVPLPSAGGSANSGGDVAGATGTSAASPTSIATRVIASRIAPYWGCANRTRRLDCGSRAHTLAVHGLVRGDAAERTDPLGHRLAYRRPRQARLLHRTRDPDPRGAARGRHRA